MCCTRESCVGQKKPRDARHGRGIRFFFWSRLGRGGRQIESFVAARDPDGERTTKVAPFATAIGCRGSHGDPRFADRGATQMG